MGAVPDEACDGEPAAVLSTAGLASCLIVGTFERNCPMFTKNLLPAVNVEKNEKEAPKSAYAAPRMFTVGATVELIQGYATYGWYDARDSYYRP